jgi:ubiquitin carboxyl-terminal hydrolase 36/42
LDIQHASTLDDALGHYFRRERLEGDNAYKCEKCKSKVPATKKFSIERAPNVLCIQLKRFGLMGGKMSKHIQFSRNLNLNRFLFHQSSGGPCVTYKFVSLINHMGPSQHCGHYTAIAEASNGQLYLFDDCSVRLISLNVAMSTGAYVLIYEKVQSSPSTPTNSMAKISNIQANSPAPTPKLPIPRPAIISEPSRPKIQIELKKADPLLTKPRLIMRNGSALFKSSTALPPSPVVNGSAVKEEPRVVPVTAPKTSPLKNPTALVPYDGESSDEEPEKETATTNATTETNSSSAVLKATETKWQVSPSPTPIEAPTTVSSNGGATVATKWQVSDNTQQDNSSSSTTSSGSVSQKWIVRSLSDTESERANPTRSEQKVYYSDTEMDPPSTKATPPLRKLGNKIRLISGKIFGPSTKQVDAKLTNETCKNNDATLPTEPVKETKSEPVKEEHSSITSTDPATNTLPAADMPAKCSNVKWDGSRTTDTVKELLRMSHSGFSDQGILLLFYRDFVLASLLILFFS